MAWNAISLSASDVTDREPIAIVGIGCRLPGNCNTPESLWKLLCGGVDAISEIPADRWSINRFYEPTAGKAGKTNTRWGGFIDGIDRFDAHFFGISPREAARMDPQQRLLLEVAWEALDDGGQVLDQLAGKRIAVFIGISSYDYSTIQTNHRDRSKVDVYTATGSSLSIAANRISYCFDFKGPSVSIDTACSSSLVGVHLACESIWRGESVGALAGGVNALIGPDGYLSFSRLSMLSADGRCMAFDSRANGFVRAEGVGIVVLKPLSLAVQAGDRIYALIKGTAVNQDGRTPGMTVPSQQSQEELVREACRRAGVAPRQIGYVEAHGTGTQVGDPIEARALGAVLCNGRGDGDYCLIGSVKSNIGHLEPAAGIAGLIKAALVLQHRQIPANLHFKTPNPEIPFDELRLRVPVRLEDWPLPQGPALAGVNSFGFGGTNAHAILEEPPISPQRSPEPTDASLPAECYLMPLSARSGDALQALAGEYRKFLQPGASLRDICHTASLRRSHHDHRLAVVAHSVEEFSAELGSYLANQSGTYTVDRVLAEQPAKGIAFVFSGQGPQWWAMGRQLLENEPVFRDMIVQCDGILRGVVGWSLLEELTRDEKTSRMEETAIAQPAIFALQAALLEIWKLWGIEPAVVVGHSVGEVAAAYAAGVLDLGDSLRVIGQRGRCMEVASAKGGMLAVGLSLSEAEPLLRDYADVIGVAAINGPASLTLSGPAVYLDELAQVLQARNIFCRSLRVNYAFHSPGLEPVRGELIRSLAGIQPRRATLPMISTVTGRRVDGPELGPEYWWQNLRMPVRFADAIDRLIEDGYRVLLEAGPHPVLSSAVTECYNHRGEKARVVASLRRQQEERAVLLRSLGALYTFGFPVDWQKVAPKGDHIRLPAYPWQRQRYWHETEESQQARLGQLDHPLLGLRLQTPFPSWENKLDQYALPYLADHRVFGEVVFPGMGFVEMGLAAAKKTQPGRYSIEEVKFTRACYLTEGQPPTVHTVFQPEDGGFTIHSRTRGSGPWITHARGVLHKRPDDAGGPTEKLHEIRSRCTREVTASEYYEQFRLMGLDYGPAFRGIERIWLGDGECLAQICITEAINSLSVDGELNAATLDACIQAILGAITLDAGFQSGNGTPTGGAYLPVEVAEVRVHGRSGQQLWSHARLVQQTKDGIVANVRVIEDDGTVVWEARGLRCQPVGRDRDDHQTLDDLLYQSHWRLQRRDGQAQPQRDGAELASPAELAALVRPISDRLLSQQEVAGRLRQFLMATDRLCVEYVCHALRSLGVDLQPGQRFSAQSLAQQCGIAPQHVRCLGRHLSGLAEEGILSWRGQEWEVVSPCPVTDPHAAWAQVLYQQPAFLPELMLIESCGRSLAPAYRGEVNPSRWLSPEASSANAEQTYDGGYEWRYYSELARQAMAGLVERLQPGRALRMLEIAGGSGGLITHLLGVLPADRTEYVFTDLSRQAFDKAEQTLRDFPFVRYQRLDIEKCPLEQGFAAHTFDVVVARQALFATAELRQTIANASKLLGSEGLLLVFEATRPLRWTDLVFGLTESWQRFNDHDVRPTHPLASFSGWRDTLEAAGFSNVLDLGAFEPSANSLIAARAPKLTGQAPGSAAAPASSCPQHWLIFADRAGVGTKLAALLEASGMSCSLVFAGSGYQQLGKDRFELNSDEPDQLRQLFGEVLTPLPPGENHGVIHLWSLDTAPSESLTSADLESAQAQGCLSMVHAVQVWREVTDRAAPLWLVTRGAHAIGGRSQSMAQTTVSGLARVVRNEYPKLRCRQVDLGSAVSDTEVRSLLDEILADGEDDEIVLHGDDRYVHRYSNASLDTIARRRAPRENSFRLEVAENTTLEGLGLRACKRRPPGSGEVEIEIVASALNFSDVMKALGLYPGLSAGPVSLGIECSGRIAALGEGVEEFRVGDEVLAIASFSFASHATVPALFVAHKPKRLSFEEAATIPIAFLTAWHALCHLGRLSAGEKVLIHSATGGVGLAAIQIARQAGAEIFATAGTVEKRDLLRTLGIEHVMDSRSLAFADEVLEATAGRGVDIVLNSLSGQAIAKGLEVLADFGRFLEIGKRDIYANSRLGMLAFRKNLSFVAIDLDWGIRARSPEIARQFRKVVAEVDAGLCNALPHRVFAIADITSAFRYMAQGKHVGKVVVSLRDQTFLRPVRAAEDDPLFRSDASYLITGGLGGFGLATARWMVEQGARHLVLMGRSGAASPQAQQAIGEMEKAGATISVAKTDVSNQTELAAALSEIERSGHPLRGVMHSAMVLHDSLLFNLNDEKFRRVFAPKMVGAWNLHLLTQHSRLDFFVCFSSMSGIFGVAGQANYAAANTFLDELAHFRHANGLPALTVNWGYLGEVGYVARHAKISERFASWGVHSVSPKQALTLLGQLIRCGAIQAGVMTIDWSRWRPPGATESVSPSFRELRAANQGKGGSDGKDAAGVGAPLGKLLRAADAAERKPLLESAVRDKLARVLGASAAGIDEQKPITELGLDSLMGVELRNWIEGELHVDVKIVTLMQGPTIAELTNILLEKLSEAPAADKDAGARTDFQAKPIDGDKAEELLATVDELSNDDVDRLLDAMLWGKK